MYTKQYFYPGQKQRFSDIQNIQKACPDRSLPKSKTESQCQEDDESNISYKHQLQQLSILCQGELSIKLAHLPPSLKRHASLKVSLTSFLSLENQSLMHYNWVKRHVSGEQEDSGEKKKNRLQGFPVFFPQKIRFLIFEEAGDAPSP